MSKSIIYYCYGGAHSSVVTAAIHLGILENNRTPTSSELLLVPYYDEQTDPDHGKLRFMGKDKNENNIYIVGVRNLGTNVEYLIKSCLNIADVPDKPIMVSTLTGVNLAMRVGGFISRKLGITMIGRPIVIWGTKKAFFNFVKIAAENIDFGS